MAKKPKAPAVALPPHLGHAVMERVPVAKLKPAKYNPRKALTPADAEYQKLKRSIENFGYTDPIIWNKRTGNVVGGHQRLNVMRTEWDVREVDVIVVDMAGPQEKALNVALNKVAGYWEDEALAKLLAELQNDQSIDETLSGFDVAEVDKLFAEAMGATDPLSIGVDGEPADDDDEEDDVEGAVGELQPTTKDARVELYGYRVPLTAEEEEELKRRLAEHLDTEGTLYGFFAALFDL